MDIKLAETSMILLLGEGNFKESFFKNHFERRDIIVLNLDDIESFDGFLALNNLQELLRKNKPIIVQNLKSDYSFINQLADYAWEQHYFPVGFLFDNDSNIAKTLIGPSQRSLRHLKKEFHRFYVFRSEGELERINEIYLTQFTGNKSQEKGPFDIIGDVHGCADELKILLEKMGYGIKNVKDDGSNFGIEITPPAKRKLIFLGDVVDRGPDNADVLKLVMSVVKSGAGFCIPGNHDDKLMRKLQGKSVQVRHGLEITMEQLSKEPPPFARRVREFFEKLPTHLILDDGMLIVTHAGIKEEMIGKTTKAVKEFCLYGETTGELDEWGIPVRVEWTEHYSGQATIVYGHTVVPTPEWVNNAIDIDTGCVFGGTLTALRYPEKELVSVKAKQVYYKSSRGLTAV